MVFRRVCRDCWVWWSLCGLVDLVDVVVCRVCVLWWLVELVRLGGLCLRGGLWWSPIMCRGRYKCSLATCTCIMQF